MYTEETEAKTKITSLYWNGIIQRKYKLSDELTEILKSDIEDAIRERAKILKKEECLLITKSLYH